MRSNSGLRIKNSKLLLVLVALLLCFYSFSPVLAQTPTPEEEATAPAERVQEIRQKAQERIMALRGAAKKRAYWGKLAEITNSTLVLENSRGERRVKTDEDTKFFLGKAAIKFEDLEIDNFIIAMGYLDESGTLLAKRIISLKTPPKPAIKRHAVYGKVTDISADEKILAVTHPKKEVTYEVQVTSKTIITKKVEGKMKKVVFADIEMGDRVVAIGTKEEENETITARIIHVIPGKAEGLEKETPTPTEEVTPTPTEEVTPTPEK